MTGTQVQILTQLVEKARIRQNALTQEKRKARDEAEKNRIRPPPPPPPPPAVAGDGKFTAGDRVRSAHNRTRTGRYARMPH